MTVRSHDMVRTTWRTALAHKGRLVLSALAVVLGVAFITGTLMLTAALDRTFLDIVEGSAQDVQITRASEVTGDIMTDAGDAAPLLIPESVVAKVRRVDGVAAAAGSVTRYGVYLMDEKGEVVGALGPPALGASWEENPELTVARIVAGRAPRSDDEIVVDETTFPKLGVQVGDRVAVVTPKGQRKTVLVGTFRFGETGGLAGATLTAFTAKQAQALLAEPGKWTSIDVAVADGYDDAEVAAAITAAVGDKRMVVKTRADQVKEQSDALREGLAFFNYIMIGFAAISLFVAAFLIHNTFSMLVAQRGRELALLRAIGATRRQVVGSVLLEALFMAVGSVAIGVLFGYLLALGLTAMFAGLGLSLTSGVSVTPQSVLWALIVGVVVTVVAALLPAARAARIPPVAALRESSGARDRVGRVRLTAGIVLLLLAAGAVAAGLAGNEAGSRAAFTALGALLLLIAVVLLSPALGVVGVRALTPLFGLLGGVTGRLSGRNAARSPRRLAATASALTIGLALVVAITIVTASAKASVADLIDDSLGADFVIATPTMQPFDRSIAEGARKVPGVEYVVSESSGPARVDGRRLSVTAVGGAPLDAVFSLTDVEGSLELPRGEAVLSRDLAKETGWRLGQKVEVTFPSAERRGFRIAGLFEPSALITGLVLPLEEYREVGGAAQDRTLLIKMKPGSDPSQVLRELERVGNANPLVQVLDQTAVKEQNSAALDQLLFLVYAMLALSIVIAALGVLNTLALSVIERTREIGMLRAIGATRRQIRRIIRWEAVAVALLGGVLGIVVGVGAGVALQRALADSGIAILDVPASMLATILVVAVLIGILAAVLPARRAARLNMLDAISSE